MRIGPQGNKQVLAAITTYKIISTPGHKQYYTNVTPAHSADMKERGRPDPIGKQGTNTLSLHKTCFAGSSEKAWKKNCSWTKG